MGSNSLVGSSGSYLNILLAIPVEAEDQFLHGVHIQRSKQDDKKCCSLVSNKMPRHLNAGGANMHQNYFTEILVAEDLASSLRGSITFNTPPSYFASIFSFTISSGSAKLLLKEE